VPLRNCSLTHAGWEGGAGREGRIGMGKGGIGREGWGEKGMDGEGRDRPGQFLVASAAYAVTGKKVKVARTRLPSIAFQSSSQFLAVSLQVT